MERQLLDIETKKLEFLGKPDDDDDLMFFKSLVPFLKQMKPIQKLRIRNQFQDIIIKELTYNANTNGNDQSATTNYSSASSVVTEYSQRSFARSATNNADGLSNIHYVMPNSNYSCISSPESTVSLQSPLSNNPIQQYIPNNETGLEPIHYPQS